ncbi:MAG: 6-hydroxymethylpterin diphosphokinase MptE-like protein [Candidatus Heimdallarchaeaceae archaeon]|jgi:uncharacterized Rossmann fold enzyme
MIFETVGTPFHELENLDFSLKNWLNSWYPKICEYLKINSKEDASALTSITELYQSNLSESVLREKIEAKEVVILAPGVNLEQEFNTYLSNNSITDKLLMCADGATSFLISKDIVPDFITTDIDGKVEDQIFAQQQGSTILLHVHGDNKNLVDEYIKEISEMNFMITTQSKPVNGSFNFLGFTDGDRAVCLSALMKARNATLIGFDFGQTIGKFSKTNVLSENMKRRKMKKFTIAKSIINWCTKTGLEINFI